MKAWWAIVSLVLVLISFRFENENRNINIPDFDPDFFNIESKWVDSVFNSLSQEQKIAQLLMIPVYSNKDENYNSQIIEMISKYNPGGIIFMQGGPVRQVKLLNKIQENSNVPVLVAMDAERSLSMRLDSVVEYPRQMLLGAIQDNMLIYSMGSEFARQLKRVGVNINFAPVCDINNNPQNPVINSRSFGENRVNVALKSYYYMRGLQDNRVIATAKHFPGHGDTNLDSHKTLPAILHSYQRLDSLELFPFKYLIDNGCNAVMTAHLYVPALDSTPFLPSSLSYNVVTKLLKQNMGFKGLVFTDALNMGGITKYYSNGDAELKALIAGNDILLFPSDIDLIITKIKMAVENGIISPEEIDNKCKKILKAKYWAGLADFKPLNENNIIEDLNNTDSKLLQQQLYENGLSLVCNKNSLIPLDVSKFENIATLTFGTNEVNIFNTRLKYYAKTTDFIFNENKKNLGLNKLLDTLAYYDLVIVGIQNTNNSAPLEYGISHETIAFLDSLAGKTKIVLDIFASPYSLNFFSKIKDFDAILISYEDCDIAKDLSAQLIFGGIAAKGKLPVSAGGFNEGFGIETHKIRLKYTRIPEEAEVDSKLLYKIDSIVEKGIKEKAYPGAQVVIARNGIVFFCKSYGYHTYKKEQKVNDFDLYDMASVTKVTATLPALMKLYDENMFSLDDRLSDYIELLKNSNKKNFKIRDILTHSAGLKPWIPFYKETIGNNQIRNKYYKNCPDENYSIQVAENMYLLNSFKDSIYERIRTEPNNQPNKYVYSDLGFYLFPLMIERLSGKNFENYVYENFYKKLGCWTTTYNPLQKFAKSSIVPTEDDNIFRLQQIHGYVHDQGCAMLGGICGHAGLFSSANDIAKIMQVFINKGEYGSMRFFSEQTVDLFTSYQDNSKKNRRGLGWDKPLPDDRTKGIGTESASELAFGHSGFTGTFVWADPYYGMTYVFNSNRVYPDADNPKIIKMNIRTEIEEIIYKAILGLERK